MNGRLDLRYVRRVCEEIGMALKSHPDFHVVVVRSTILPGSMREVVIPTLEEYSEKKAGKDFGVCNNPEFLREGTAVYDFYHPPKTVIGETDARSGELLSGIYEHLDGPLIRTGVEPAEMVKYADNTWHALKICFANEIGTLCKGMGLDSHQVMDIFCQDTKLNISPTYLKPGFAFGGSCLPKDVRALCYKAGRMDLDLPVLKAILPSNRRHMEKGLQMIMNQGHKKVGILGMSFKVGTDDLRESPVVEVIERLLGKGFDLRVYDRNVQLSKLVGANRDYILNIVPHISRLMVESMDELIEHSETVVIGNADPEFRRIFEMKQSGRFVVDLVRIAADKRDEEDYDGICW
jgi:GDP-mannose 6-dehydrogenase